jgi:hypothetical protein
MPLQFSFDSKVLNLDVHTVVFLFVFARSYRINASLSRSLRRPFQL